MRSSLSKVFVLILIVLGAILAAGCGDDPVSSKSVPVLSTAPVTGITETTAQSGGTITSDGGATVTARGVCWSTNANPTVADSKTADGTGTGSFTSGITGLTAGTDYYVRAYATNSAGTGYGSARPFTTTASSGTVPVVTTTTVSAITQTTAQSGGTITSDGGTAVTARGVCWSTNATPTIADNKTTDGNGSGSYVSHITGLTTGTDYYVRAYATNSAGTGYGSVNQFETLGLPTNLYTVGAVYTCGLRPRSVFSADLDGNTYSDLIVANSSSDNVTVFLNSGDGTFNDTASYNVGDHPISVGAATLDGDADIDIVVVNQDSKYLSILWNNGQGMFPSDTNLDFGASYPSSVVCCDLDGDGYVDLATAVYGNHSGNIWWNNGDGTFIPENGKYYDVTLHPTSVTAATLNGDATVDLVFGNNYGPNTFYMLFNDGNRSFTGPRGGGFWVNYPRDVVAIDLDGDHDNDLAFTNFDHHSPAVTICGNNGDGTFYEMDPCSLLSGPMVICAGDFDLDNDNDLAVAGSGGMHMLLNDGDGTFQEAVKLFWGNCWDAVPVDIDRDGDLDLVIVGGVSNVTVLLNGMR